MDESLQSLEKANIPPPPEDYVPDESNDFGDKHAKRIIEETENDKALQNIETGKVGQPKEVRLSPFSQNSLKNIMQEADAEDDLNSAEGPYGKPPSASFL